MKKLIIKDGIFTEAQKQAFLSLSPELEVKFTDLDGIEPEIDDLNAIIGNYSKKQLARCRNLEWMQLQSSGADLYSSSDAVAPNVIVTTATGAFGVGISEYMTAMLINMMKRIPEYLEKQKLGVWQPGGNVTTPYGKRVLIVGTGNLGTEFAKRIRAFGSEVIGIRRRAGECPKEYDAVYGFDCLAEELKKADVVALCLPGTPETTHMMNEEMLLNCKQGAYLMNVGRGNVIPLEALLKAEITSRFAGIWLDVVETEPLPDGHALFSVPNVYITPHISGGYFLDLTVQQLFDICYYNAQVWLNGGEYRSVLDRKSGYCK